MPAIDFDQWARLVHRRVLVNHTEVALCKMSVIPPSFSEKIIITPLSLSWVLIRQCKRMDSVIAGLIVLNLQRAGADYLTHP